MEKPKTFMLRLYPDKAADQILINYLKDQRNIQQYLKQLIEKDIEKKQIVQTIRDVMEEYLQPDAEKIGKYIKDSQKSFHKDGISIEQKLEDFASAPEETLIVDEESHNQTEKNQSEDFEENEDVEEITPDALAFLDLFGTEE